MQQVKKKEEGEEVEVGGQGGGYKEWREGEEKDSYKGLTERRKREKMKIMRMRRGKKRRRKKRMRSRWKGTR